ncbi:GIY-YIG nuclease family protein [Mesorhizobium sp. Z1-4]|uniref:GIY-YIG nuclease family protein n=1 Tax=Mesorhizobium sp. Z1-4 TaxID=2448478 RepID=UPI000FDA858E|nr:GIY-YIG nuclease family protein [Mesorhizobium sp. Z1-4]
MMSRPRTFTKAEIMDAARAAAETGLCSKLDVHGCIVFSSGNEPVSRPYPAVPFPAPGNSRVYFLQSGFFIKIGVAVNVRRRHGDIQGANPAQVRLIHHIPGGGREEKVLHARFDIHHHSREWFLLRGSLLDFLDRETGWAAAS